MIIGGLLEYITSALWSLRHTLIHEGVKEKGHNICVTEFLFTHPHHTVRYH